MWERNIHPQIICGMKNFATVLLEKTVVGVCGTTKIIVIWYNEHAILQLCGNFLR